MKERPIIFSTQMVRAILDGRKTQTRRVITPQPVRIIGTPPNEWPKPYPEFILSLATAYALLCPYGQPGDLLWVRETWASLGYWEGDPIIHEIDGDYIIYRAENINFQWLDPDGGVDYRKDGKEASHWKSSRYMPKKYARIWLEITNIRVEKLQDISETDAVREGIPNAVNPSNSFRILWDSICGKKYPWSSNPWVWVIEFKRINKDNES